MAGRGLTLSQMRNANRAAILEALIRTGPAPASALARDLGLSRPAVRRLVNDLKAARWVRETSQPLGAVVEVNGADHLSVGLDLGGTKFFGAVTDLAGTFRFERTVSHHGSMGEAGYRLVVDMLAELLAAAQTYGQPIMGIGVGVPGVTQHQTGLVVATSNVEWYDFPLGQRLQDRFHLPVAVDNDVNLAALGEAWFGAGKECRHLIWINVGTGIGAGLLIDGRLYRGAQEIAGEIGYLLPGREFLKEDYPGFGALELQAAGVGLARRGAEALRRAGVILEGEVTARTVAEAYQNGEAWAVPLIEAALDYLAIAIGAAASFLDPELVVLGGGVMQSLGAFVEPLARRLAGKIARVPPIVVSSLGARAAVLGGMISLLPGLAEFDGSRKLP